MSDLPPPPATPAPQKKRRRWPWVLLGVLIALIAVPAGCVALLGAAVDDAADEIDRRQQEIQADVQGCTVVGPEQFNDTWLIVECVVVNQSSNRSNYSFTVGATVDGQRYGTTTFLVDNLRSGETATVRSTVIPDGDPAAPDPATVELEVFDVTRFSAE